MKWSNVAALVFLCLSLAMLGAQDMDLRELAENDLYRGDLLSNHAEDNGLWEDLSRSLFAQEMMARAEASGLESFSVNISDDAISIDYQDIRFLPGSAEITPEVEEKIDTLMAIVRLFPDMELLIQGHTARLL